MTLLALVLVAALAFAYINGFHDTANAIATVVSTKVLSPRLAVAWASIWNLVGALAGTAVATTIGKGLVDTNAVTMVVLLSALLSAIAWGLLTWWLGLPSSSSHALVGGLCGATVAGSGGNWAVLKWTTGLWPKVVLPMILSPFAGIAGGFVLMAILLFLIKKMRPTTVTSVFGRAQLASAGFMGFSHGSNDAQKTMGIVTLILFTATRRGLLDHLPAWAEFLRIREFDSVPHWIVVVCAIVMAAGTAGGGMRIIRTMGHKLVKLQPVHGFAAETTAAAVIYGASLLGVPVSTTHVISTSIMGVGATKRLSAVKWGVVERIVWAWVLTLPVTALLGAFFTWLGSAA
ncbi:MAG TPA: inorganic phosphate transporter [Opitutaceae bacterium]|jgi:PiT family inorganic phosphate transporter